MKTLTVTPMQLRECIAHIGCMSESQFAECFEDMEWSPDEKNTCYQYMKFVVDYKRNVGSWICYLDLSNLAMLITYLNKHLKKASIA